MLRTCLVLMLTSGCELIASVDRGKLEDCSTAGDEDGNGLADCADAACPCGGAACTVAEDCPDTGSECMSRVCTSGTCSTEMVPAGTPLSTQTASDCKVSVCDGSGNAAIANDDIDTADDANECTIDTCQDGGIRHDPAAFGTACATVDGTICDGEGHCIAEQPAPAALTALWSYNEPPTTSEPRWSSATNVTVTLDATSQEITTISGGVLTDFAPGACLPYEPIRFDHGRILQWSTGGNASCMPEGALTGLEDPIGNFNAVVGSPTAPLAGPSRTDGYQLGGTMFSPTATSPMFDIPAFFNADLTGASASVAWAGASTHVGLRLEITATELSGTVHYTLETTGGYAGGDLSSSELAGVTDGIVSNTTARIPVTADVAGVACGGTTSCYADVRLMFLGSATIALVYQIGGEATVTAPDDLAALRGAVVVQAP